MLMKLRIIVVIIFIIFSNLIRSQYYTSGEDPASLKWNSIETENFKLVFPKEYTNKAQQLAKIFERVYLYANKSLDHTPNKICVLIHPETTYSNGFVTWAPKRIELFPTPNQDIYSQDWLQQLALHEFRHVVQIDKLNKGFVKILSFILGEQAVGGVLGLYMPMWFLEGDAVVTETALSNSGRGRSPWFEQKIRAQLLEQELYSYDKAYFGSYKNYIPNYYEMGYLLVAGARVRYGTDIWSNKFYDLSSNTLVTRPFLSESKLRNSINKDHLYYEIFSDLHKDWLSQDSLTQKSQIRTITSRNKEYVSFKFPALMEDGNILSEISGPGEIDRFVKVDSIGNYSTVFIPGKRNEEPFSYSNNIICWTEFVSDKRWSNRGWSVIKCYDLNESKEYTITQKSRYFSPSLNSKGNLIAAVKVNTQNEYCLSILNREKGEEIDSFKYNKASFYMTPSWSPNNDKIVCVSLSDRGKKIVCYNILTKEWTDITSETFDDISLPKWKDEHTIIFTAGYSGTEEIYSVNIETRLIKQITQSRFGSTGAIFNSKNKEYIFSCYTSDGFQLSKSRSEESLSIPYKFIENNSIRLDEKISEQEQEVINYDGIDTIADYNVKKYSKLNHLFNIHSWAPVNINVNDESVSSGLSVMSQNLLGTAITSFGYNFDSQKSRERYHLNFQYRGLYPVFEFDMKFGDERVADGIYTFNQDTVYVSDNPKQNQTKLEVGVNVPLNLTSNKFYRYVQPSLNINYYKISGYNTLGIPVSYQNNKFVQTGNLSSFQKEDISYTTLEYSIYLHNLLKKSERDVNYRWGQVLEVNFQSTPFDGINIGKLLGLRNRLYFPGLLKYHSIKIDNEFQYKWKGEEYNYSSQSTYHNYYRFGNYFSFARGYYNYSNDELYSLKTNYMFPLWNPDISISKILYLKRVTSNIFFDYSSSKLNYYPEDTGQKVVLKNDYKSIGIELLSEVHVFRFLFPFNIGYRYSRLLDLNSNGHELLMGINISGFSIGGGKE